MKRTTFLMLLLAIITVGCAPAKKTVTTSTNNKVDSIIICETVRDTIVTVQADSSTLKALLECDSLGQVRMRELLEYKAGERTQPPQVIIHDNVLTASSKVDSVAIYLTLKDTYEKHVRENESIRIEIIEKEVNRLTWWQSLWYRLGITLTIACSGIVLLKIFKPKIFKLWQKIRKPFK